MVVTPREIDLLIDRAAKLLSMAINRGLQPSFSLEDLGAPDVIIRIFRAYGLGSLPGNRPAAGRPAFCPAGKPGFLTGGKREPNPERD